MIFLYSINLRLILIYIKKIFYNIYNFIGDNINSYSIYIFPKNFRRKKIILNFLYKCFF